MNDSPEFGQTIGHAHIGALQLQREYWCVDVDAQHIPLKYNAKLWSAVC